MSQVESLLVGAWGLSLPFPPGLSFLLGPSLVGTLAFGPESAKSPEGSNLPWAGLPGFLWLACLASVDQAELQMASGKRPLGKALVQRVRAQSGRGGGSLGAFLPGQSPNVQVPPPPGTPRPACESGRAPVSCSPRGSASLPPPLSLESPPTPDPLLRSICLD